MRVKERGYVSFWNKAARGCWSVVWLLLYRPTPSPFHAWRRLLLRMFGAHLDGTARIYPSARIWAPWNLRMGEGSCLADQVLCYNVGRVTVGKGATVSQNTHLCTASHDFDGAGHDLIVADISIGPHAWVAADVFVGPGVDIGERAVALARSVVTKDVPQGMVVAGNPARVLRRRHQNGRGDADRADTHVQRGK